MFYLTMHSTHFIYGRKEILYLTMHSTHFIYGRKEILYLMMHSTHFTKGYMASRHMVKNHSDRERGNMLPPHGLLFLIKIKDTFLVYLHILLKIHFMYTYKCF